MIIVIQSDFATSLQKICNPVWWIAGKECPQAFPCPIGDTLIEKVFIDVAQPHIRSAVKDRMHFIFDAVLADWAESLVIWHLEPSPFNQSKLQLAEFLN